MVTLKLKTKSLNIANAKFQKSKSICEHNLQGNSEKKVWNNSKPI